MSDLGAAAAALGIPEALVQRSAEARAAETGGSVDDILVAWAGGAAAPPGAAVAPDQRPAPEAAPEPVPAVQQAQAPPEIVLPPAPAPIAAAVPAGPYKPPVLVGSSDNPMTILTGAIALFASMLLIGLVGPASQADQPGALSSEIPYDQAAVEGQAIYGSLGCASCHTQMVRPVIADVGLGAVTLNDSNQVLGTRRHGPDLSDVGSRLTGSQIEATIGGWGGHPGQTLSDADMGLLVAYLEQSMTSGGSG